MLKNRLQTSSKIAALALTLWTASLFPIALVFYYPNSHFTGAAILLVGWLAIFSGSVSWFANIFFIYSNYKIFNSKVPPYVSSTIAIFLALSMFMLRVQPSDGEVSHNELYGYGIGSLLWLIAICLNLVAACIKKLESSDNKIIFFNSLTHANVLFSTAPVIAISAIYLVYGIYDHKHASIAEDKYLKNAIFKLGSVCELPDITPSQKILLDEPLEIYPDKYSRFEHPDTLLRWGIPAVQKNGFIYSLENPNDMNTIIAKQSKESSSIELMQTSQNYGFGNLNLKLAKTQNGKETVAFDALWLEPKKGGLRCPRFVDDQETMEPLRSLVISSFTTPNGAPIKPVTNRREIKNGLPEVLTITNITKMGQVSQSELEANIGCSQGNGLFNTGNYSNSDLDWLSGNIYIHDGIIHFPLLNPPSDSNWTLCKNKDVYLLQTIVTPSLPAFNDILYLDKRDIGDFHSVWGIPKQIEFNRLSLGIEAHIRFYKPLSITEEPNNTFAIQIVGFAQDSTSGYLIDIKAKR